MFSLINKPKSYVSAEQLEKILCKKHGADEDTVTRLIHPTVSTFLCLDMVHTGSFCQYSCYSTALFRLLDRQRVMFQTYMMLDMFMTVGGVDVKRICIEISAELDMLTSIHTEQIEDIDKGLVSLEEALLNDVCRRLHDALDDVNIYQRIESVSRRFDHALRLFMALGVCPLVAPLSAKSDRGVKADLFVAGAHKPSSLLSRSYDGYMTVVETGLVDFQPMPLDDVITDLLITSREGVLTLSRLKRNNVEVDPTPFYFSTTHNHKLSDILNGPIPSLADVLAHELQHRHAHNESQRITLERLQKSYVFVSTELTKEVKNALAHDKTYRPPTVEDLTVTTSKTDAMVSEFELQQQSVKDFMMENGSSNMLSTNSLVKQRTQDLQREFRNTENLQTRLMNANIEYNALSDVSQSITASDGAQTMMPGTMPFGARDPNSRTVCQIENLHGRERSATNRLVECKKVLKKQEKLLQLNWRDNLVLNNENLHLRQVHTTLINGNELLKKEMEETRKLDKSKDKHVAKLTRHIEQLVALMKTATASLKLSVEDRDRILQLTVDSHNATLQNSEERVDEMSTILNTLIGSFGIDVPMCKQTDLHRATCTRIYYDRVISQYNIRIAPIFSYINNKRHLFTVNQWLPFDWMHDRPVYDNLARRQSVMAEPGLVQVDDLKSGKYSCVGESNDLFWLDINPLSKMREEAVRESLQYKNVSLTDEPFFRRYLTGQFKSKGDLQKVIDEPLQDMWKHLMHSFFEMSEEFVTVTGQKLEPRLTKNTVRKFIVPFVKLFTGTDKNSVKLCNFVEHHDHTTDSDRYNSVLKNDEADPTVVTIRHYLKETVKGVVFMRKKFIVQHLISSYKNTPAHVSDGDRQSVGGSD